MDNALPIALIVFGLLVTAWLAIGRERERCRERRVDFFRRVGRMKREMWARGKRDDRDAAFREPVNQWRPMWPGR